MPRNTRRARPLQVNDTVRILSEKPGSINEYARVVEKLPGNQVWISNINSPFCGTINKTVSVATITRVG